MALLKPRYATVTFDLKIELSPPAEAWNDASELDRRDWVRDRVKEYINDNFQLIEKRIVFNYHLKFNDKK